MDAGHADVEELDEWRITPARSTPSCACSPTSRAGSWASGSSRTSSSRRSSGEEGAPRVPLPAGHRHGDGAAPRLPVRELGDGLRRLPDGARHRRRSGWCPWLEKTAMVICDIADEETERAGRGRAAADPEAPDRARRGSRASWSRRDRSWSSTCSRTRSRTLAERGYRDAAAALDLHHGLPHAPDHQGRVDHPRRSATACSAPASRSSSPRASSARASTRSTSRYADALRDGRPPRASTSTA